jgi:hypothetical protein
MELDEEKKEIYDNITQLFNGIEDISLKDHWIDYVRILLIDLKLLH